MVLYLQSESGNSIKCDQNSLSEPNPLRFSLMGVGPMSRPEKLCVANIAVPTATVHIFNFFMVQYQLTNCTGQENLWT